MDPFFEDPEVTEEFDELFSITTKLDTEDLSDLEADELCDLDDEDEDFDF